MIDTHFISKQNQFLHLDTKKILTAPLFILLESVQSHLTGNETKNKTNQNSRM